MLKKFIYIVEEEAYMVISSCMYIGVSSKYGGENFNQNKQDDQTKSLP
jgi:hypothetical protein